MHELQQYWIFAAVCLLIAVVLLGLVLRERITIQGSLWFLMLLGVGATLAVFPGVTGWAAAHLGFALPSNFIFAVCVGAMVIVHLSSLVAISRVELRSIVLTQELAILQEQVERITRVRKEADKKPDSHGAG